VTTVQLSVEDLDENFLEIFLNFHISLMKRTFGKITVIECF